MTRPASLFCYGIPRAECYGVRLASDYQGEVPPQMLLIDVPEGEYIVYEHGPFDYEQENRTVEEKINAAIANFNFSDTPYCLDATPAGWLTFSMTQNVFEIHQARAEIITTRLFS